MGKPQLPEDYKEFLKLLNDHRVKYLIVGGFAVNFHGYSRSTIDIDIWVARDKENARRVVNALREFGFGVEELRDSLFLKSDTVVRMGLPPLRIEILTSISGVEFESCFENRETCEWDGIPTQVLSLEDLKVNKKAANRLKDLLDLEQLGGSEEK
jgi:predicted nucleotidyltransferase